MASSRAFFEAVKPEDAEQTRKIFQDLNLKVFNTPFFDKYFAQYTVVYLDFTVCVPFLLVDIYLIKFAP